MLERDQVTPELAVLYDKLLHERGIIPNMFKTVAHVPDLAMGFAAFLKPLMGSGALEAWYKELIATRMAYLNSCGILHLLAFFPGEASRCLRRANQRNRELRGRPLHRVREGRFSLRRQAPWLRPRCR